MAPVLQEVMWRVVRGVACSHVSGLLVQSGRTAGPDGFRASRPHHSNGIAVPMNRQVALDCVGSTDCTITLLALSQARSAGGFCRCGPMPVTLLAAHHRPGDARR